MSHWCDELLNVCIFGCILFIDSIQFVFVCVYIERA